MVLNVHKTIRLIKDGQKWEEGMEVGGGGGGEEIIFLSLHCHDFCFKVGSDESHFNVS